ncbi:MAG: hypothetical protein EBS37_16385, partial [Betaproteobacteria bacterium]|nr:hypothetical protein [Betaproteobacteria bacterium]
MQFGTLNFNNVAVPAGVTVTGVGTSEVTLTGDETAVNTYLANFGYTPNAGYINANTSGGALASGAVAPDVLSMSVTTANNTNNPVTGSLNLLVKATDNKPRIVSPLPDRMYYAEPGVATETAITLTLADADTVATAFVNNATSGPRIVATSDNPNLILPADMATAIGGSGNARTFTVKHQPNITGVANVTITINDGALQNTYTFKVTVVPAPQYYWSILAGSSTGAAGSTNATGTSATFSSPFGMVRDSQGNLFVSDAGNHGIRKITPLGVVTTFAGTLGTAGYADGTGTAAKFNAPAQLAIDASDNIYVADQMNHRIRKIDKFGVVTTIAGTGTLGGTDGAVASATFNQPTGIAITPTGVIYVADKFGHIIRKIDGGQVTTLAGAYGIGQFADAVGSAARFNRPTGLGLLPDGNLLVRDGINPLIRHLNITTLAVTTYATSAINQDGPPNISPTGDVYATVLDNSISVFSSFDSAKLAGTGTAGSVVGDNATATFSLPRSMAFGPNGTLYLVSGGANNIRMGSPIPSLANPGKQVVGDTQLLTFASAATQRLSIQSNGAAEPLTLTLAVTKGKVTLSQL